MRLASVAGHAACCTLETAAALAPKERPKQGAVSAVRLGSILSTAAGINSLPFARVLQQSSHSGMAKSSLHVDLPKTATA